MIDSFNEQILDLTNMIDEFDKLFGHIDDKTLNNKDKKAFVKLKKEIDSLRHQKKMMEDTLQTFKDFGATDIIIGK